MNTTTPRTGKPAPAPVRFAAYLKDPEHAQREMVAYLLRAIEKEGSQREVARNIGVHYVTVNRVVNGSIGVTLGFAFRVCRAYPDV